MKLVAAMRVKNESWVISYTLSSLSEFVDEIVIYDDGSTDDTVAICKSFNKVACIVERKKALGENCVNEAGDWNLLTKLAVERGADWILFTDADEMLEPKIKELIPEILSSKKYDFFRFRKVSPWKGLEYYRTDSSRFDAKAEKTLNPVIVRASRGIKWNDGRGSFIKKFIKKMVRGENIYPSLGRGFPTGVSSSRICNNDNIVSVHFNHFSIDRLIRKQVFYALVEKRMRPYRKREDIVEWVSKGWNEDGAIFSKLDENWLWSDYISLIKKDN